MALLMGCPFLVDVYVNFNLSGADCRWQSFVLAYKWRKLSNWRQNKGFYRELSENESTMWKIWQGFTLSRGCWNTLESVRPTVGPGDQAAPPGSLPLSGHDTIVDFRRTNKDADHVGSLPPAILMGRCCTSDSRPPWNLRDGTATAKWQ